MDSDFQEMIEKMKTLNYIERAQYFSDLGRWKAEMDFKNMIDRVERMLDLYNLFRREPKMEVKNKKMRMQMELVKAFNRKHDLKKVCEIIIWTQDGYTYELNMN